MCIRLRALSAIVVATVALAGIAVLPPAGRAETTFPSRRNTEGRVTVTVTPLALSGDIWRFNVQLETHVTPLTQDVTAVSTLSDGKGRQEAAVAWQGDPPGGHHRKGVLIFRALAPRPNAITVTIRGIGSIPERAFSWTLE